MKKTILIGRLSAIIAAASMMVAFANPVALAEDQGNNDRYWVGTWTTGPHLGTIPGDPFGPDISQVENATLRQIVHISLGGNVVRIRFSNEFGQSPLVIESARIAMSAGDSSIAPGTSRELTFGGQTSISIPAGAPALSDPVSLSLPPLSNLAISAYFPQATPTATYHLIANQTTYLSTPGTIRTLSLFLPIRQASAITF
jgi:hypothetical protein